MLNKKAALLELEKNLAELMDIVHELEKRVGAIEAQKNTPVIDPNAVSYAQIMDEWFNGKKEK